MFNISTYIGYSVSDNRSGISSFPRRELSLVWYFHGSQQAMHTYRRASARLYGCPGGNATTVLGLAAYNPIISAERRATIMRAVVCRCTVDPRLPKAGGASRQFLIRNNSRRYRDPACNTRHPICIRMALPVMTVVIRMYSQQN